MLAQRDLTNLEFNCNQRFKNKKTKLNICHPICSGRPHNCKTGHFTSWEERERLQNEKKNEKYTCKACKTIVFHCQICKFVRFLLPSSSRLLKLFGMIGGIIEENNHAARAELPLKHFWRSLPSNDVKFSYMRFWRQRESAAVNLSFSGFIWKSFVASKRKYTSPSSYNVTTMEWPQNT